MGVSRWMTLQRISVRACTELLWNYATQHITSKDYKACMGFCTAALGYAAEGAKFAVALGLAKAHLALQELDRSAQPH